MSPSPTPTPSAQPERLFPDAERIEAAHHISLLDAESATPQADSRAGDGQEESEAEFPRSDEQLQTPQGGPKRSPSSLRKSLTRAQSNLPQEVRKQWQRRKYAKFDRERYDIHDSSGGNNDNISTAQSQPTNAAAAEEEEDDDEATPLETDPNIASKPQAGDEATPPQTSFLERHVAQTRNTLNKHPLTHGTNPHLKIKTNTTLEILYENQRGFFLLGKPHYSASTLLPRDPAPWQNAHFRSSPVDIRNAQLPDPANWEWVWRGWFVDMGRDVDCLLYTSPSPRDRTRSRMPSSA